MPRRLRDRRAAWSAAVLAGVVTITACGGGGGDSGDAERFCGEVAAHRDLLTRPELGASGDVEHDIDELLAEYRRIGELAPLSIEAEWDQLTAAYETAAAVEPGDAGSEQEALEAIFRSERSAVAIARWLRTTCGINIGPISTIVPAAGATTTTSPPTTDGGATPAESVAPN